MRLNPAADAAGYRLVVHETLPSTNTEALTLARAGEHGPLWLVAHAQTAGRGRRGNEWISAPGNLYATLLITEPAAPEHAAEASFVTALAVYDAIAACAVGCREKLALKWPNDILCEGAKLAGILLEAEVARARFALAIGIGVNCAHHPDLAHFPATDLAAAGAAVTPAALFQVLSATMMQRFAQWGRGTGFRSIRAEWLDRAAGIGGDMRVRLADRELFGRCEALDERGRLLLRLRDGSVQIIAAGEVFPVVPADLADLAAPERQVN